MSLMVHVFADTPDGHSDLAGFESWRTAVWGSPEVYVRSAPGSSRHTLRIGGEVVVW